MMNDANKTFNQDSFVYSYGVKSLSLCLHKDKINNQIHKKKKIKLVGGKSKSTQKAKKNSNFMETENQKLLNSSKQRMNEESKTYLEPVKQLEAAARLEK